MNPTPANPQDRDPLDENLRALGQGTPFPVDWQAYERQLLARLARAQGRRMRRGVLLACGGALAGAAASLLVAFFAWPQREDPGYAQADPARKPSVPENISPLPEKQQENAVPPARSQPMVLRRRGRDGTMGEIRFMGATPPAENRQGIIVTYAEPAR